jgi:VanZ family protein
MLELRHRPFWIGVSVALVLLVVWGSLQTSMQTPTAGGFDKVEHLGTYLVLAVWFTGLYRRPRYGWIAAALLALGLSMEFAQFAMHAGRQADPYDMLANATGVMLGTLLALRTTGGWAQRIEAWWHSR